MDNNSSGIIIADSISSIVTCPITCDIIEDPVIDPDGNSYERSAIHSWLERNDTSPITRTSLCKEQLIPNHSLLRFLVLFRQQQQQQQQQQQRLDDNDEDETEFDDEDEEDELLDRLLVLSADGGLQHQSSTDSVLLLTCPITGETMKEPVIDPEGYSFDKSAISTWISYNGTSPLTESPITSVNQLIPNRALALLLLRYHQLKENQEIIEMENNNNTNGTTTFAENSNSLLFQSQQITEDDDDENESTVLDSLDDEWTSSVSDFWNSFTNHAEDTTASTTTDSLFLDAALLKLKASYNKRNALVQIQVADDIDNHQNNVRHHLPSTIVVVVAMNEEHSTSMSMGYSPRASSSTFSSSASSASLFESLKDSILTIIQALDASDHLAIIVSNNSNCNRGSNSRRSINSRRNTTRATAPHVILPITKMTNEGKETAAEALLLHGGEESSANNNRRMQDRSSNNNFYSTTTARNSRRYLSCAMLQAMNMIRNNNNDNDNSSAKNHSNILLFTNINHAKRRRGDRERRRGMERQQSRPSSRSLQKNNNGSGCYHHSPKSGINSSVSGVDCPRKSAAATRGSSKSGNDTTNVKTSDRHQRKKRSSSSCARAVAVGGHCFNNNNNNNNEIIMMLKRYKKRYTDFQCRISTFGLLCANNNDGDNGEKSKIVLDPSGMTKTLISMASLSHGYYYFLPKNNHAILLSSVRNIMANILSTAIQETTLELEFMGDYNGAEIVECVGEMMGNNNNNNRTMMTATTTLSSATATTRTNRNKKILSIIIPPLLYGQTFDVLFRINSSNDNCNGRQNKEITSFCVSLLDKSQKATTTQSSNSMDYFGNILAIENAQPIYKNSLESDAIKLASVRFKLIHFLSCTEKCFFVPNDSKNNNSRHALQQRVQNMLYVLKKYVHSAQTKNHATGTTHDTTTKIDACLDAIQKEIQGDISNVCGTIASSHQSTSSYYWASHCYILSLIRAHTLQQPQQCHYFVNHLLDGKNNSKILPNAKRSSSSSSTRRMKSISSSERFLNLDYGDGDDDERGNNTINGCSGGSYSGGGSSVRTLYPTMKFDRIHTELCGGN